MSDVAAVIAQETALIGQLLELLEQEQQALKAASAEPLAELSSQKLAIVDQLNSCEEARSKAVSALFPNLDPQATMQRWLDRQGKDSKNTRAWARLLDLARTVRQQQDLNGHLVRLHLQHTGQALAALQTTGDPLHIYGSDGQSSASLAGRISDSA